MKGGRWGAIAVCLLLLVGLAVAIVGAVGGPGAQAVAVKVIVYGAFVGVGLWLFVAGR